ncbi:MAG: hypothetical protein ACE5FH_08895 [Candidatus Zixiibacteriota bacterium]
MPATQKQLIIFLLVVIFSPLWVVVPSFGAVEFRLAPYLSQMSGHTSYEMDIRLSDEDVDGDGILDQQRIRSKLRFPLGAPTAGISLQMRTPPDARRWWAADLSLLTNLQDPSRRMEDHDWYAVGMLFNEKTGFTESKAELDMTYVNGNFRFDLFHVEKLDVGILASFTYQKITQRIIGFRGWYLVFNGATGQFEQESASGNLPAIDYWVRYVTPQLGGYGRLMLGSRSSIEMFFTAGMVFASDFDDHLLRGKRSDADGTGPGISLGMNGRFPIDGLADQLRPFVELFGSYRYLGASGDQTQTWYRDEKFGPNPGDVVTQGTSFSSIPHDFTSSQLVVGLRFGIGLQTIR